VFATLTLMAFNPATGLGTRPVTPPRLGVGSVAAYAGNDAQTVQNHVARITFDWTNHGNFHSSISFTPTTNLSN
jgi:hypothetical protein